MPVAWQQLFAERTTGMRVSDIREILKITAEPDIISLAGGLQAPELFPIDEYRRAFEWVLEANGPVALQYGPSEGYAPLREFIAARLGQFGITSTAGDIQITSGSQQALDLVGKVLLDPGDTVLVEKPTYLGALQAFNQYQAAYRVVPMDDDGMCVDEVPRILDEQAAAGAPVKLIYAIPNFQNPTGRSMSAARRGHLVEIAGAHGVPILEDDPYGELRYEGVPLPSLKSLDRDDSVIYMGTFSKTLAPGFRLGWILASPGLSEVLLHAKQPSDLHTGMAQQMAAFPDNVKFTRPAGGMFVWAELPGDIDTRELLVEAVANKVAFVPGQGFHPDGSGHNTLRLNFSNVPPQRIKEGVRRLGDAIERRLRDSRSAPR